MPVSAMTILEADGTSGMVSTSDMVWTNDFEGILKIIGKSDLVWYIRYSWV